MRRLLVGVLLAVVVVAPIGAQDIDLTNKEQYCWSMSRFAGYFRMTYDGIDQGASPQMVHMGGEIYADIILQHTAKLTDGQIVRAAMAAFQAVMAARKQNPEQWEDTDQADWENLVLDQCLQNVPEE